jgi:hypothetical protein
MVASRKNTRMVASESSLEHDLLILLEFDPTVERYEEQPVKINYTDEYGRPHTYTPDVLIYYYTGKLPARLPLLCEVKYRAELAANWKEIKPKIRAGRSYARQHGWHFKIMTEHEIRTQYLENAKFLRRYRTITINESDVLLLIGILRETGESNAEQLLTLIYNDRLKRAELLPTIWHLVSNGVISADLNKPLTMSSPLWVQTSTGDETSSNE